jgi:hypothetical protein
MEREPQRRITLIYSVLGTVALALVAAIAIALKIQERNGRVLAE